MILSQISLKIVNLRIIKISIQIVGRYTISMFENKVFYRPCTILCASFSKMNDGNKLGKNCWQI